VKRRLFWNGKVEGPLLLFHGWPAIALLEWKSRDPFWHGKADRRVQQIASRLERKLPEFSQIEAEPHREIKLAKLKKLLAEIRSQVFDYAKELPPLR